MRNLNNQYGSFEVYSDLNGLPIIRRTIADARRVARRFPEAWICGEPIHSQGFREPLHFLEFWQ